tara:strand:+ start:352 stop:522 length:171 start_codon:yes stop_codon:yes gene_type:complete
MMSTKLAVQRLNALQRAADKAKDPEFKKLWKSKRKELVEILQSGNSYDELSGELLC